jgi:hypothetical protein
MTVLASGLGFEAEVVALPSFPYFHGPPVLSLRACWAARPSDNHLAPRVPPTVEAALGHALPSRSPPAEVRYPA